MSLKKVRKRTDASGPGIELVTKIASVGVALFSLLIRIWETWHSGSR